MLYALYNMVSRLNRSKILSVILLSFFWSLNTSRAFSPGFDELGSTYQNDNSTTHHSMTICALSRVTIDYLKTAYKIDTTNLETRFTEINGECQGHIVNEIVISLAVSQRYGANPWQFVTTVKTIASADAKVDLKEFFEDESHFDNEVFVESSRLIMKRYQAAVDSILKEGNYDQARNTFGEMLHTLQDFYSHSNHIELGYTSPSDVLGQRIFRENEFASVDMRTCVSCEGDSCQGTQNIYDNVLKNKILTSGYFALVGAGLFRPDKPPGKCSHGGFSDATSYEPPTGGINKDSLSSVHGSLHPQAAAVAYQASVKILKQLRNQIGDDHFGLFLALKKNLNSLVISIDTTSSTINYQELAKNISMSIVNQYSSLEYAPYNYILTSFNSDNAEVVVKSRNPGDLIDGIRGLKSKQMISPTMGEMYYHSLVAGLKQCQYASVIYTFLDSPAKDAYLKYEARALLRSKQAIIYSFISEEMIGKMSEPQLDYLNGNDNDTDLTSISGGLTFPITNGDQSVIAEFILRRLEWARLEFLSIYKTTSSSVEFYVDSSIDELHIHIASIRQITDIRAMELRMANNSLYPLSGNFINTKYLYMWRISQPNIGTWRLTTPNLSQGFNYDVRIQGRTSIVCSSTLQKEMDYTTVTNGSTRLSNEPIINSDLLISTTCENLLIPDVNISLIDLSGNIIASYSPTQKDQFGALTRIRVPQQQFRIQTIIDLSNGTKIQRTEKQLISPTIFSIQLRNRLRILSPGETMHINYTIKSAISTQVTVRLQISDTLNLISNDTIEKDLTFINEISGIQTITLPKNYKPQLTTNIIIFSVSTKSNQTNKYLYQNDETTPIYLDINSASMIKTIHYFTISLLLSLYHISL